ncbi:hypothetical protein LTR27_009839 [Elasticomyces elasticus]|nr:hypothetical protein LTR27_009839 [Elasticomyces elasticus]
MTEAAHKAARLNNHQDLVSFTFSGLCDEDKTILIDAANVSRSVNRRKAYDLVAALSGAFTANSTVCLHLPNDVLYPVLVLAILASRCRWTGSNPAYTMAELEHHFRTSETGYVVTMPESLATVQSAVQASGNRAEIILFSDLLEEEQTGAISSASLQSNGHALRTLRDLLQSPSNVDLPTMLSNILPDDIAALQQTSGTTGLPKMAMRTHHSMISELEAISDDATCKPYEIRRLFCTPIFHAFSAPEMLFNALRIGQVSYFMRRFDDSFAQIMHDFRITETFGAPAMLLKLASKPKDYHLLQSLRYVAYGGAPLGPELRRRFLGMFEVPPRLVPVYGMTEGGWFTTFRHPEEDDTGSVGRPVPGCELKISSSNYDQSGKKHSEGEILVRGPQVMQGYLGNAEATSVAFDDGWLKTGDIGHLEDGKLYLVDRVKDMIKVNGWQVSPVELQNVLLQLEDVLEAAVLGEGHDVDEHPVACVVKKEASLTAEAVREHLRGKLASYKSLAPDTAPPAEASIRGIVTLLWPYSSSTKSYALLIADPDFRLRKQRGQVRVRFHGEVAAAVARARLGIGDEVVLRLQGADWEQDVSTATTPGRNVGGELSFGRHLDLRIARAEGEIAVVVDAPAPQRSPVRAERVLHATPVQRPSRAAHLDGPGPSMPIYSSPAFTKRMRLSGDFASDLDDDPFRSFATGDEQPHKKLRLSFGDVGRWRFAARTPSPVKGPPRLADETGDDEQLPAGVGDPQLNGAGLRTDGAAEPSEPLDAATHQPELSSPSRASANRGDAMEVDEVPISDLAQQTQHSPISAPPGSMMPPPLPRLITTESPSTLEEVPDSQNDASERSNGPTTPKLNAVPNSALPLPSPFPTEQAQQSFPLFSAGNIAQTSTVSTRGESPGPEQLGALQHVSDIADEDRVTPQSVPSHDASSPQKKPSAKVSQVLAIDRPEPELHVKDLAPSSTQDREATKEINEVPTDQTGKLSLDSVNDGASNAETASATEDSIDRTTKEAELVQQTLPTTQIAKHGSVQAEAGRQTPGPHTPAKEVTSKPMPFGISPTVQTTAPASQTTPQSQRDRVMARTYSSLFGFKRSPPPQPQFHKPPAATLEPRTDRSSDGVVRISQLDGADEMDVEEAIPPPMEDTMNASHDEHMSYSPPAASSLEVQAASSLAHMEDQAPSKPLVEPDIEVDADHVTQLESSPHKHIVTDISASEIDNGPAELDRPIEDGLETEFDSVHPEIDIVASGPSSPALPAPEVIELGSSSDVEELADSHAGYIDTASSPPQYASYEPAHGAFDDVSRDDEDRHEPNANLLEPADDNMYEQNEQEQLHYLSRSGNVADTLDDAPLHPDTIQISSDIDEDIHQYDSVETRHDEPMPAQGVTEASHVQHEAFQAQLDDLISNPQTATIEHGYIEEATKLPPIVAVTEVDDDLSSPPPTSQLDELEQEVQSQASPKQAPPQMLDDSERSSSPFPELIMPSKRKSIAPIASQADTMPTGMTPVPLRVSTDRIVSTGVPAPLRVPPDRVIEDSMDDGMSGTMSTQPTPIAEKFDIPDPPLQESVLQVPAEPSILKPEVATVPAHEDIRPPETGEIEFVEAPRQGASSRVISAQKRVDEPFLQAHESTAVSGEYKVPSQDPTQRLRARQDEREISASGQESEQDAMAIASVQPAVSELAYAASSTARTEVIELGSSSPAQEDFEPMLDDPSSPVILSESANLALSEAPTVPGVLLQATESNPASLLNDTRAFTPKELVAIDEMGVMASPNRAQSAEPVPSEVSWQSQVRGDSDEDDSQATIVPANQESTFVAEPHASYSQGFETQVPLATKGIFSYPELPLSPLQSQPQPQSQHDQIISEVQDEISNLQQSDRETPAANPAESYSQTFETQIPLAMNGTVPYESLPLSPLQSQPRHENNSSEVQQEMPIVQQGYQETPASDMPPTPQLTQHESDMTPALAVPFNAMPALPMQLDGTEERDETVSTNIDEPLKAASHFMPAEVQEAPTVAQNRNAMVQAEMYKEQPSVVVNAHELPPSSREHIRSAPPNNTPARKSLKSRLSGVPDVISTWFSSPKRQKGKVSDAPRKQHEDVTHSGRSISNGITTNLAYFTPLARLEEKLNSPTQEGPNNTVDVLVVVTDSTKAPDRAKGGPRDYYTILRVADLSQGENENVRVEVFRPWKATLPVANVGDVILLRAFSVKSRKREAYLLSTDASAWCVWRYGDAAATIENGSRPVWARKSLDGRADGMHEEIKGPPVELGDEERRHASVLREWWVGKQSTSSGLKGGDADAAMEGKISDVPVSKL